MRPRFALALMLLLVAALAAACGVAPTSTPNGSGSTPTPDPTSTPTPAPTNTPTPTPRPQTTPVAHLPEWLNDLIVDFESEPVANPPIAIKEYVYNGETVYYVPARCCDIFSDLYDADGNLIAHPDGGIAGHGDGRAQDFHENAQYVRTIWQDPRGSVEYERQLAEAPIESADVLVLESFPPQYRVLVVSGLPSGCAAFDHWTVDFDPESKTFNVQVYNSMPADGEQVACTMVYGTIENSIPLAGPGYDVETLESGVTYTVRVNDYETSFDAQ